MKTEKMVDELILALEREGVDFGGKMQSAHHLIKRAIRQAYSEGVTDAYDAHAYTLTPRRA